MNKTTAAFLVGLALIVFGGLTIAMTQENHLTVEMGKQGLCKDKNAWIKCK